MRRHSNPPFTLLIFFALLIWLGMACSTDKKAAEIEVAPSTSNIAAGNWRASFQTPEGAIEVIMHIRYIDDPGGGYISATVDVPAIDAYAIPLIFSFENDVVHWEIEESDYSYNGKLTDPLTIEGSVSQPEGDSQSLIFKYVE